MKKKIPRKIKTDRKIKRIVSKKGKEKKMPFIKEKSKKKEEPNIPAGGIEENVVSGSDQIITDDSEIKQRESRVVEQ